MRLLAFLAVALTLTGCRQLSFGQRGAILGGTTGAGAGAIIGDQSGHAEEGALIGAAVGAATGGLIGDGLDEVQNSSLDLAAPQQAPGGVTTSDLMAMSQAGLGEEVIVAQVRRHGFAGTLTTQELIAMKQQGVSDRVLQALQQRPSVSSGPPPVVVVPPSPVVVPHVTFPVGIGRRGPGCKPRRVGWGFSVGF